MFAEAVGDAWDVRLARESASRENRRGPPTPGSNPRTVLAALQKLASTYRRFSNRL